jgi:hypothetical protein
VHWTPIIIGIGIGVVGLLLLVLGIARGNVSLRTGRGRALKGTGFAVLLGAFGWIGYTQAIVPSQDGFVLKVQAEVPKSFYFVPVVFQNDRECPEWERDLCHTWMGSKLPGHEAVCLVPDKEFSGTFAQAISSQSFKIPKGTFILRGDIKASAATGTCTIYLSKTSLDMKAHGVLFTGTFRCNPKTVCR